MAGSDDIGLVYITVVLFLITLIVLAGGTHWVHKLWCQESMVFMLGGMLFGVGILQIEGENADSFFQSYFKFSDDTFFLLLLPPIIVDAGYNMNAKANFFHNFSSICAYAVCGTLISTGIIGMIIWIAFRDESGEGPGVSGFAKPALGFKLGAMLSATDPVATLSVLSSLRRMKDPHLYNIIFGESVVNDAVAIVLFEAFKDEGQEEPGSTADTAAWVSVLRSIGVFFYVVSVSILVGLVLGAVCAIMTKHFKGLKGSKHLEVLVIYAMAYLSYVFAEHFELSGIMSLFVCSMMLSHYSRHNITREAAMVTVYGFRALAFLAEAAVFAYLGVDFVLSFDANNWSAKLVGITLPACLVARVCNILFISMCINCWRRKNPNRDRITWRAQAVLIFAGLRGAIAYALSKRWQKEAGVDREVVVTTTTVVILVTTFGLGGSVGSFIRALGLEAEQTLNDGQQKGGGLDEGLLRKAAEDALAQRDAQGAAEVDADSEAEPVAPPDSNALSERFNDRKSDWGCLSRMRYIDNAFVKPLLGGKIRTEHARALARSRRDSSIFDALLRTPLPSPSSSRRQSYADVSQMPSAR